MGPLGAVRRGSLGAPRPFSPPSLPSPRLPSPSLFSLLFRLPRLSGLPVARASIERAKELTKQITAADGWRDVVSLLREDDGSGDDGTHVNLRHLTTAMYFLTKKNRGLLAHDEGLLKALADVATRIAESDEAWSSASLANVLQACGHLAVARSASSRNGTSSEPFDRLRSLALGFLASGIDTPLSNVEFLTILSCMVHVPDSLGLPEKASAAAAMEAALVQGDEGPVRLRTKGLEGFHPRDLGSLSWALTEVKCTEATAQLVFDHCMSVVGAANLSAPGLCLACRMISMQGSRARAEDNLKRIVAGVGHPSVLRELSSLRDSTMLLLAVARMAKSICEDDVKAEESLSFGVKWTFAVVAYRRAHPAVDRLVQVLCTFIKRALSNDRTRRQVSRRHPSSSKTNRSTYLPEDDGEVSHSVYSSVLYSLALLQYPSTDVIAACARGLTKASKKLTLRTIATCTWSLAVLRYEEPRAMRVFAKRVVAGRLLHPPKNNGSNKKHVDKKDMAQSVSMLLYGFAVLNLLHEDVSDGLDDAFADDRNHDRDDDDENYDYDQDSGEVAPAASASAPASASDASMASLLAALMRAARPCLDHLGPEALPVFGWSIVIAHSRAGSMDNEVFEDTMRVWRQAVADAFAEIPVQGRPMIHHTEIALSLEAPGIKGLGATGDLPFDSLMELLYASGRLRRHALREWNAQSQTTALDGISLFQKQVFGAAERACPGWQMEYWDERLQYPVDMALPSKRLVIEVDGPTHFMTNANKPLGATVLKRRLLERLGWRLVVVPYFEWSLEASDDEHDACMRAKLEGLLTKAAGLPSTQPDAQPTQTHRPPPNSPRQRADPDSVRSNASKLDAIRAMQGKMSVNDALKRKLLRGTE